MASVSGLSLAKVFLQRSITGSGMLRPASDSCWPDGGNLMLEYRVGQDAEITAAELKQGQYGIIWSVLGDPVLRRRLNAMGIVKGTMLMVERTAPLGDPRSYRVLGGRISLRREEAAQIMVRCAQ